MPYVNATLMSLMSEGAQHFACFALFPLGCEMMVCRLGYVNRHVNVVCFSFSVPAFFSGACVAGVRNCLFFFALSE